MKLKKALPQHYLKYQAISSSNGCCIQTTLFHGCYATPRSWLNLGCCSDEACLSFEGVFWWCVVCWGEFGYLMWFVFGWCVLLFELMGLLIVVWLLGCSWVVVWVGNL
jgi:hypothetical protein